MLIKDALRLDGACTASVDFHMETKADGDALRFSGLASTFGNRDRHGDVVEAGAFAKAKASSTLMLWQHDTDVGPIGIWDRVEETSKGLEVEGHLFEGFAEADRAAIQLRQGGLKSMSIGFMINKGGAVWDDDTMTRRLTSLDVLEISLVSIPANPKARIGRVKCFDGADERTFEAWLRDAGASKRLAQAIISKGYRAAMHDSTLRDAEESSGPSLAERIGRATAALKAKTE